MADFEANSSNSNISSMVAQLWQERGGGTGDLVALLQNLANTVYFGSYSGSYAKQTNPLGSQRLWPRAGTTGGGPGISSAMAVLH